MKYLACLLLGVFAALSGVATEDCSYENCKDLLDIMGVVPSLSEAYCSTRKMLKECLETHVGQCPSTNVEIFTTLLEQYESTVPCSDVNSTSITSTSAVVPSSSVVTPQATSILDCTYDVCQTWLDYLNTLEDLTIEYCRVYNEFSTCVSDTFVQCGENNMETFIVLFGQLSVKPTCPNTVATTTTGQPSPTMTFSATPSPTIPSSSVVTPQATSTLDCTYDVCQTWLGYLNTLEDLTVEYCRVFKEFSTCVSVTFVQCGENNEETFTVLFGQLSVKPTCPNTVATTTTGQPSPTMTFSATPSPTIPSSSVVTPQATSTLDCTYDICQTWLGYLNTLEDLTVEYCRVFKEFSTCVSVTFGQCGENNMETFTVLFGQLNDKPTCPDTVTTTAVITTTVQPSPTMTSSATPSPTITLDCSFRHCGDLAQRLHGLVLGDTNYCEYLREANGCLDYTLRECPRGNFLVYQFTKGIVNSYQQCNDTTPSPTSTIPSPTSTTLSPTPTCLDRVPIKVSFNDKLPDFVPPEVVDNEHRCGVFKQEEDIFYHCSFYTYSHLRAFRSDDLYTCSSPGLWALFSHPSLQVTVLNVVPDLRGPYTLADEVSIVIPQSRCSQRKIYHIAASRDSLPISFDDGTVGTNGLQLFVNVNKTSAYINISWINTTVAVHKLAGFVGVVVLSPQRIADESVGLCSLGCPDHSKYLVQNVPSHSYSNDCEQEAIRACISNGPDLISPLTDEDSYFDRCIFDVLKSRKANSSWMSTVMVHNLQSLGPIGTPPSEPSTTTPWPIELFDNYQDKIDPEDYDDIKDTNNSPGLARPLVHVSDGETSHSSSTMASSSILLMVWCILQWHAIYCFLYT